MHWFKLMLLMLPALGGPGDSTVALSVTDNVNHGISLAVEAAAEIDPAWELAARAELADSPVYAGELIAAIESASEETGIDPAMLWSVAWTESHGRHYGSSGKVKRGGSGEVGLMQIKPFWSKALKKKHGIDVDLYKVSDNIRAGAHILSRGGDNPKVMLSYYNTGQMLSSTAYQRKVMKYWTSLDEIPATLEVKVPNQTLVASSKGSAVTAKPAKKQEAKPVAKARKQDGEAGQKKAEQQEDTPPARSFRPE